MIEPNRHATGELPEFTSCPHPFAHRQYALGRVINLDEINDVSTL
jgi:hypothetical protein